MKFNYKKDEHGVAHLMLIVLVAVVVAVIGGVAWKVSSNKNGSNSSTGSSALSAQAKSACMSTYNDSSLCSFEAASAASPIDKTAYTATLTNNQSGSTSTLTFKQDGKGNTALTMTGGDVAGQFNTIEFGGSTYMQSDGTWIKYPSGSAPTQTSDPSTNLDFLSSLTSTKFTKVGTEACGDLSCLKYQISDNITPNATQYVWFDTSQYKLREWKSTDSTSGTTDMKLSYGAVSISAPSPVQDFSATQ